MKRISTIFFIESTHNDRSFGVDQNGRHHHSFSFDDARLQGECARLDSLQFARFAPPELSKPERVSGLSAASAVSAALASLGRQSHLMSLALCALLLLYFFPKFDEEPFFGVST